VKSVDRSSRSRRKLEQSFVRTREIIRKDMIGGRGFEVTDAARAA
jgi:hypothetical protein